LFEHLARHRRIAVTGPQRSGTTIAAKMIAMDTGFRYVDERDYAGYNEQRWRRFLAQDGVVVQCPTMLKDLVDDPPPDVYVVLMRRPLSEIRASADRINWESRLKGNTTELQKFGLSEGDSALVKYRYWATQPKRFPFLELPFDLLTDHPLYIEKALRVKFQPKQTVPR
jgi:hypothetical protein